MYASAMWAAFCVPLLQYCRGREGDLDGETPPDGGRRKRKRSKCLDENKSGGEVTIACKTCRMSVFRITKVFSPIIKPVSKSKKYFFYRRYLQSHLRESTCHRIVLHVCISGEGGVFGGGGGGRRERRTFKHRVFFSLSLSLSLSSFIAKTEKRNLH